MKLVTRLLILFLYLSGLVYLALPQPEVVALPNALRSTEPGDTWQNPDQSAYYTNLGRSEVLEFYQDTFSLNLFGLTLPSYRLNYPPEDSRVYVRDHLLTYYLEEINHPLRESLFVAGWNPRLSPISNYLFDSQYDRWAMVIDGVEYQSKVTLKPYYSSPYTRFFIWTSIFPLTYLVFNHFRLSLKRLLSLR
ncbi:MAG: hypothetical protein BWY29_00949 [Microgenomates group bacterium ADurb.Bin238]|nr:MAG: hypothetical protein BWY29_00949 [Microgenomates group bacterium ADurb.Bin238]